MMIEVDPEGISAPRTKFASLIHSLGYKLWARSIREPREWLHHKLGSWLMDRSWRDND